LRVVAELVPEVARALVQIDRRRRQAAFVDAGPYAVAEVAVTLHKARLEVQGELPFFWSDGH